jgi:hypothetical protein
LNHLNHPTHLHAKSVSMPGNHIILAVDFGTTYTGSSLFRFVCCSIL